MEVWHIWTAIALLLIFVEIITVGFAALCLSIGAIGAAITSSFTDSLIWQIFVFAIFTLISFVYVRPLMQKLMTRKNNTPKSGVDALIGRIAIVEEDIKSDTIAGRITIDGDSWKAVSENGESIFKGEKVEVLSIDSIILTVKKI